MLAFYETLQPLQPSREHQLQSVAEEVSLPARTIRELRRLGDYNAAASTSSKSFSQRFDIDRNPFNTTSYIRRSGRKTKKNRML